nr:basic salivary proline-rich protein 2-like [Symphalangus syndactylus]
MRPMGPSRSAENPLWGHRTGLPGRFPGQQVLQQVAPGFRLDPCPGRGPGDAEIGTPVGEGEVGAPEEGGKTRPGTCPRGRRGAPGPGQALRVSGSASRPPRGGLGCGRSLLRDLHLRRPPPGAPLSSRLRRFSLPDRAPPTPDPLRSSPPLGLTSGRPLRGRGRFLRVHRLCGPWGPELPTCAGLAAPDSSEAGSSVLPPPRGTKARSPAPQSGAWEQLGSRCHLAPPWPCWGLNPSLCPEPTAWIADRPRMWPWAQGVPDSALTFPKRAHLESELRPAGHRNSSQGPGSSCCPRREARNQKA